MIRTRFRILPAIAMVTTLIITACTPGRQAAQVPEPQPQRFFGIHCDFHAGPGDTAAVGSTLREEDIREICTLLHPDFIQVDTKGHPGWVSYPTKIGNAMPRFACDPLKLWRRVTKEEGVALYSHYSGVWDSRYVTGHPEEAVLNADGTRSDRITRTAGPYVDELLIPQLCELAGEYGMDGVWVDGDCWATATDFDPRTIKAFETETGIDLHGKLPSGRGDDHFEEYRDYCRELFRRYVRHYTDSVHSRFPNYKITSNWSFTDHMPEPVSVGIDYISGDLTPTDSFFWARYSGRAIEKQGLPWDLMAWGFRTPAACGTYVPKHPVQLMQEAAAIISLGGGFQIYIPQKRDGSPDMEKLRNLRPVADFVQERREWTFGGHLKPQVAVLLSTTDQHLTGEGLFSRESGSSVCGLVNLLCDAGHSVSVVSEHDIAGGNITRYPVIAIPSINTALADETVKLMTGYVHAGGSLLLTDARTCRIFAEAGLPCAVSADTTEEFSIFETGTSPIGRLYEMGTLASAEGEIIATHRKTGQPVAAVRKVGNGMLGIIPSNLGLTYTTASQYQVIDLVHSILDRLYEPEAELLSASGHADVALLVKDGRRLIQITNTGGCHHCPDYLTEDVLAPACDIVIKVRCEEKPAAIRLQPEGSSMDFDWAEGTATITVPRVDVHSVLEIVPR